MKDDLKSIWISFVEAVVRFWNNRFIKDNDEVIYLRMELDKSRMEVKRLTDHIIEISKPVEQDIPAGLNIQSQMKPINYKEPFHITRQRLELESHQRAQQLAAEARANMISKTTEQLESELLSEG